MDPKQTIKKNILRRAKIVNTDIKFYKNVPLPTWIELSLIDVCNRKCTFCPKSDEKIAPDTHQKMSKLLIDKLAKELKLMKYRGAIALCGYGEPLLHKEIIYITKTLSKVSSVEIVTNGDVLTAKTMKQLYEANASKLLISLYDGSHQIKKFKEMLKEAKVPDEFIILRDRWYDKDSNFGVKLTNRTGTINIGNQISNDVHTTCFYPSYQFLIDWNGDIFLCPQDWQRKMSMGNMMQDTIYDIWVSKIITKYRKLLLNGKRKDSPCNKCNAQGTLLGQDHAKIWRAIYNC
tara:strand:+ start:2506 stop:3375 length:870 start_codon:yes stop_codon:yes gene_type:complete